MACFILDVGTGPCFPKATYLWPVLFFPWEWGGKHNPFVVLFLPPTPTPPRFLHPRFLPVPTVSSGVQGKKISRLLLRVVAWPRSLAFRRCPGRTLGGKEGGKKNNERRVVAPPPPPDACMCGEYIRTRVRTATAPRSYQHPSLPLYHRQPQKSGQRGHNNADKLNLVASYSRRLPSIVLIRELSGGRKINKKKNRLVEPVFNESDLSRK